MIRRLLMLCLLLHHIEGVCKPFSDAGRIVAGLVDQLLRRDRGAAIERAHVRKASAVERAQAGRPRRGLMARRQTRAAIEPARPVLDDWAGQVQRHHEQERG